MNSWNLYGLIILGILFIPHLLLPLVIRINQKINPFPDYQIIDSHHLPDATRNYFEQQSSQLQPLGFTHIHCIRMSNFVEGQTGYLDIWFHQQDQNSVAVTDLLNEIPNGNTQHLQYLEFNTLFSNGKELSLVNNDISKPPGSCSNKILVHIPDYNNLEKLYRLHKELKIYYGHGDPGNLLEEQQLVDEIRTTIINMLECTAQAGYQYLDPNIERYRPTLKGAYVMTWQQIWPMKNIQHRRMRRKAKRLLELI